jgi:dolichol-phosphate mannosyltransferase
MTSALTSGDCRDPQASRIRSWPVSVPRLSIVVPVYNESESLPCLVEEIRRAMRKVGDSYEMLFVDDCSRDHSLTTLRELRQEEKRLRIVCLKEHGGQSAALAAGFSAARAPVTITLDADLQNDPDDIPELLAALEDADVVSGIRIDRQDTWKRRFSSRIANSVRRWILGDSIHDVGCSLKAFRTDWLRDLPVFDGMHRFLPALIEIGGGRVKQIPVRHRPRRHGESTYGVHNRLWRGLGDLLAIRWLKQRWIARNARRPVDD